MHEENREFVRSCVNLISICKIAELMRCSVICTSLYILWSICGLRELLQLRSIYCRDVGLNFCANYIALSKFLCFTMCIYTYGPTLICTLCKLRSSQNIARRYEFDDLRRLSGTMERWMRILTSRRKVTVAS